MKKIKATKVKKIVAYRNDYLVKSEISDIFQHLVKVHKASFNFPLDTRSLSEHQGKSVDVAGKKITWKISVYISLYHIYIVAYWYTV